MDSFIAELRKIPPVTRFLCGSLLGISLPLMLGLVSGYRVLFVWELVAKKLEVWRFYTSFFIGSPGISFLFDLIMLYRNSNQLEDEGSYRGRSADYAYQLLLTCLGIVVLNTPLNSYVHTRALLHALTYLNSILAPPGTQTSIMGLITIPITYLPYCMVGMDLLMGGPRAAAQAVSGLIAGHVWWWLIWGGGAGRGAVGRAPEWMRRIVGEGTAVGSGISGVHVVPPRRPAQTASSSTATTSGHQWGSGNRLGTS